VSNDEREFDVVVWGATGFTGKLVVEYLASRRTSDGLRWAIAGRSADKLAALKAANGCSVETIVADSFDRASLDDMAKRTKVVLSTVGPYAKYGSELVAACVTLGTHYCDLAGEVQWIRRMIDEHQETARSTGARIVHCCGFDSIPSELGVFFLQQEARGIHGSPCHEISMFVKSVKGGLSGGTFASMMNALREIEEDRSIAKVLVHPYSLNPEGERQGPDGRDQNGVRYSQEAAGWTAPFIMAGVNTKVVRRGHALMGYPYGKDFRYSEASLMGKGPRAFAKATSMAAGLGGFVLAAANRLTREHLVERFIPQPGQGPSKEERENGFFKLLFVGKLKSGIEMRAQVTGDRDPGYGSTAKMLSESAICLALDDLNVQGGFWTPASAMGEALLRRLEDNAGLRFQTL
jgi:short subunit dehydrogenase-like uncharacterized protein